MRNLCFGLVLLFSISLFSQRNPENDYWNSYRYTPKKGMVKNFEAAVAKKMEKFNSTPETAMFTYRIVTGRNSGTYERVESMKYPKDYDVDRSAELEYWEKYVSEYVEKSDGQLRWDRINSATINWDPNNPGQPSRFLERTTYDVKPGHINDFRRFMDRITVIRTKRGAKETQLLFRCISGNSENMYVMVRGWNNYTDDTGLRNKETKWRDDYDNEYGWGSFHDDLQKFRQSLEAWGEMTETMELVPALTTGIMN